MITPHKSLMLAFTQSLADNYMTALWVQADKCQGLPRHLTGGIRLYVGLNMPVPINDLRVDENGISGTFSFSRVGHFVVIPWEAVEAFMDADEADRQIEEHKRKTATQKNQTSVASQPPTPQEVGKVIAREGNVLKVRFSK